MELERLTVIAARDLRSTSAHLPELIGSVAEMSLREGFQP
jgi:hypothetical protein